MRLVTAIGVLVGGLLASPLLHAESLEEAVKRDLPGWSVNRSAQGDLDGDGIPDDAAILDRTPAGADRKEALLVVYLSDAHHERHLKTKAPKAICVGCGGPKAIFDEPLGELEIRPKGILTITYQGGSREEWEDVRKWRLDKSRGDFLLIGETYTAVDTIGEEPTVVYDVNFSTLRAETTVGKKKKTCKVAASAKGRTLAAFDFEGAQDVSELLKGCR